MNMKNKCIVKIWIVSIQVTITITNINTMMLLCRSNQTISFRQRIMKICKYDSVVNKLKMYDEIIINLKNLKKL